MYTDKVTEQITSKMLVLEKPSIKRFLTVFFESEQVFEVRMLKAEKYRTISGFFDNADDAIEEIGKYPSYNTYITINELPSSMLALCANKLKPYAEKTTANNNVVRYKYLVFDIDPVREGGISDICATEEEKRAAEEVKDHVLTLLTSLGWPEPAVIDSGNGFYVIYRIDIPNDNGSAELIKAILEGVGSKVDNKGAHIDTGTFNPARIFRLAGTVNMKGTNLPDRPYRVAKIVSLPEILTIVPHEKLEEVAKWEQESKLAEVPQKQVTSIFNLDEWIQRYLPDAEGPIPYDKGRKWILPDCPMNPEHTNGSAFIIQRSNGIIQAGCHHNSCQNWTWKELREKLEPGCYRKKEYNLTDSGNAQMFAENYKEIVRFCYPWKTWMIWDGRKWERDNRGVVMKLAKELIRKRYLDAVKIEDFEERKKFIRHIQNSENAPRLSAMLELSKSEMAVTPEEFDSDIYLLNCQNGVLDLNTGEFLPHDSSRLMTKITKIEYLSEAGCPRFETFLNEICLDDEELIRFIQKYAGLSLSGVTQEQCFCILLGKGANGKSLLLTTLMELLGDYAVTIPADTLMERKRGSGIPNDLAMLAGSRMAVAIETGDSCKLDETKIKSMTGGDKITARFLFGEYFSYTPKFKIWMASNHKPVIRGSDHGIWRRIRLLSFLRTFTDDEQDKTLSDTLRKELPGILRWAFKGYLMWKNEGLKPPSSIQEANAEYKAEFDTVQQFISECCSTGPGLTTNVTDLYVAYKQWASTFGEYVISYTRFRNQMAELGYSKKKTNSGRYWLGIEYDNTNDKEYVKRGYII